MLYLLLKKLLLKEHDKFCVPDFVVNLVTIFRIHLPWLPSGALINVDAIEARRGTSRKCLSTDKATLYKYIKLLLLFCFRLWCIISDIPCYSSDNSY